MSDHEHPTPDQSGLDQSGHDQSGHDQSGHDHAENGDDCVEFLDRIVYFIDNELDEADCAVVQVHLRECGPCLERYDLQRTVKALVARSCSEAAPDGLRERVQVQLRAVRVQITEGGNA